MPIKKLIKKKRQICRSIANDVIWGSQRRIPQSEFALSHDNEMSRGYYNVRTGKSKIIRTFKQTYDQISLALISPEQSKRRKKWGLNEMETSLSLLGENAWLCTWLAQTSSRSCIPDLMRGVLCTVFITLSFYPQHIYVMSQAASL